MEYIVSRSIFVSLFLLLFVSFYVCAHIPRLGVQRRTSNRNKLQEVGTPNGFATFYYKQPLDHFNYQPPSYVTYDERYFIDFRYWEGGNPNTPIFAFLGAESEINIGISYIGLPAHFISRYKALVHRFYGKSVPFGSIEKAMENATIRGYFNSAQALADYAQVLLHVKKTFASETSPIIVIGASYGGRKLKYPHIALGALASSAPILYFDNITPQDGYYSIVSKSFRETSKTCYESIRRSWSKIDQIAEKAEGLSVLSKRFKTCEKLKESSQITNFLDEMYTEAAQYNNPHDNPVSTICAAIDEEAKKTSDVIDQIIAGVTAFNGKMTCYDMGGRDSIELYGWQTCSETVMPIGISGKDKYSMFPTSPFNLNEFESHCKALYGVSPKPHWITTFYGGQDLKLVLHRFASNIIFSNGLKDPYSSGGVLHNISQSVVALTTAKGSHCIDLDEDMEDDPDWLIMQRKAEMDIIDGWISEYRADVLLYKRSMGAH